MRPFPTIALSLLSLSCVAPAPQVGLGVTKCDSLLATPPTTNPFTAPIQLAALTGRYTLTMLVASGHPRVRRLVGSLRLESAGPGPLVVSPSGVARDTSRLTGEAIADFAQIGAPLYPHRKHEPAPFPVRGFVLPSSDTIRIMIGGADDISDVTVAELTVLGRGADDLAGRWEIHEAWTRHSTGGVFCLDKTGP